MDEIIRINWQMELIMKKYNVNGVLVLTEIIDIYNEKEKEKALTEVEIAEARDIAEAEKF